MEDCKQTPAIADSSEFAERAMRNGLGYVLLDPNLPFASQVVTSNTRYEIRDDFNLNNGTVAIPVGCVLVFTGGTISGGTLTGANTVISAEPVRIFDEVDLNGDFIASEWYGEWFGASAAKEDNASEFNEAITQVNAVTRGGVIRLLSLYKTKSTVYLRPNVGIVGDTSDNKFVAKGTKARAGFMYMGISPDVWVLDTKVSDDSLDILPYNQLGADGGEGGASTKRTIGVPLRGFWVTTVTRNTFGGIRLFYNRNRTIADITISCVRYGLAISCSWSIVYQNIRVNTPVLGFFFGPNTTKISLFECAAFFENPKMHDITSGYEQEDTRISDDVVEFSNAVFGSSNSHTSHIPPYTDALKNAAILIDDRLDTRVSINISGMIFQDYDAAILSGGIQNRRTSIVLSGAYFERIKKTLFWTKYGCIRALTPHVVGVYQGDGYIHYQYMFGTEYGSIIADDYPLSTCYPIPEPAGAYPANIKTPVNYVINVSQYNSLVAFYDTYEYEENASGNIGVVSKSYTDRKKINLQIPRIFVSSTNYVAKTKIPLPGISLGTDHDAPIAFASVMDVLNRLDNDRIEVSVVAGGWDNLVNTGVLKNKTIITQPRFRLTQGGIVGLDVDGCHVIFEGVQNNSSVVTGTCLVKITGGSNHIEIERNQQWYTYLVCIDAPETEDVRIHIVNRGSYNTQKRILNTSLSMIRGVYEIVFDYLENDEWKRDIVTNKLGPTSNRPSIGNNGCIAIRVGQEYFDTDLGKKIVWNGTSWVNMDGTALLPSA